MALTIDSLYEQALKKLTTRDGIVSFSKKFSAIKTQSQKTLFVHGVLKDLDLLPNVLNVSKSEKLSEKFRELGNERYKKHQYYRALQFYNMSLSHAPNNSSQLCLAYANRSAVLHSLRKYNECIKDIEKVFSMQYPDKIQEKLLNRKKLCHEAKTKKEEDKYHQYAYEIMKPMQGRNSQYQCASSKLKVCYTKELGRHVIATEDIDPGEILAVEEPYACCLLKQNVFLNCSRCFSFNINLIPCDDCCMALFCSDDCKEKALKEYHSDECAIIASLATMDFTKLEMLAFKIVIKARRDQPTWESLIKLVKEADTQPDSDQKGMVCEGGNLVYDSKYYQSIHSLATNEECRDVSDIFQKSVSAAALYQLMTETNFFNDGSEEARECAAGMLLKHLMTSPTNMHNVSWTIYELDGSCANSSEIGSAAYGFLSLINHSCAPNVVRFERLGAAAATLVALRRISKGTQIFDNYGFHHALQLKMDRQLSLMSQYKFFCNCEACTDDWPLYRNMPRAELPCEVLLSKEKLLNPKIFKSLQFGSVETTLEIFRPLCNLAKRLEDFVPCAEIGDAQEAIKQCAFIMHGILPHGYSEHVDWQRVLLENI